MLGLLVLGTHCPAAGPIHHSSQWLVPFHPFLSVLKDLVKRVNGRDELDSVKCEEHIQVFDVVLCPHYVLFCEC